MPFNFHMTDVLDQREVIMLSDVLGALEEQHTNEANQGIVHIREGIQRLRVLWAAIESFPRIQGNQVLGSMRRDLTTLLDTLAQSEPYTIETKLPTRAALARSYGLAKFNFFRMIEHVVRDYLPKSSSEEQLAEQARAAGRGAAAALIEEDVLRSIACGTNLDPIFRRRATRILAALWDQRATRTVADFTPLLDSAWQAKAKVRIAYGTLLGMSEINQLIRGGLDPEFIDCLTSQAESQDKFQAFEEFLFNLTHEQLNTARSYMRSHHKSSMTYHDMAEVFHVPPDRVHTTTVTAEDMFFTFREREMWARFRRLSEQPGPKKTAEEYVMIHILGQVNETRGDMASLPDIV